MGLFSFLLTLSPLVLYDGDMTNNDTVKAFYSTHARAEILLDTEDLEGFDVESLTILLPTNGPVRYHVGQTIAVETFDGSVYIADINDVGDAWSYGDPESFLLVHLV